MPVATFVIGVSDPDTERISTLAFDPPAGSPTDQGREEKEKQSFHNCMVQALRVRFSDFVDKFTDLGCWFLWQR